MVEPLFRYLQYGERGITMNKPGLAPSESEPYRRPRRRLMEPTGHLQLCNSCRRGEKANGVNRGENPFERNNMGRQHTVIYVHMCMYTNIYIYTHCKEAQEIRKGRADVSPGFASD